MIIDVHTHAFPEAIAAHAIAQLEARQSVIKAHGNGTILALKESMAANHVDYSVVLPVATKAEQVQTINDYALASHDVDQGIIFFGGMHPNCTAYEKEIKRLAAAGIKGIKFHAEFTGISIDEPNMRNIHACMAEYGLIALHHMGDDLFAGCREHASPQLLLKVVTRQPNLKVIAAHGGGFRRWQEFLDCLAGHPNVWIDTAFLAGYISQKKWMQIILKHDRILLGSDFPWMSQTKMLHFLKNSELGETKLNQILAQNAIELLQLKV